VFRGLNRLLATAAVAVAVFAVPSTALASGCGGGPSAEQVYKECLPNGGGGKSTSGAKGGTNGGQTGSTVVTVSPQVASALEAAGKEGKSLKRLVNAYGLRRHLQSSHATAATEPTAIGSAFDLGSGPTALLIILAGTAFLLLGGSGMRVWRSRHRQ
jgi:hypothetical protein